MVEFSYGGRVNPVPSRPKDLPVNPSPLSAAFSRAAVDALPGPDWLRDLRRAVHSGLGDVARPDTDDEVWRYSRVGEVEFGSLTPVVDRPSALLAPDLGRFGATSATVVVHDGWIADVVLGDAAVAAGVTVGPVAGIADGADHYGAAIDEPVDLFGHLNRAFGPEPVAVVVPDGVCLNDPILVVSLVDAAAAVFPRLLVHVGADAQAEVIEVHTSSDVSAVVAPVLEVTVDRAGRYRHARVQNLGPDTWQFGHQAVRAGTDASVELFMAGIGGDYVRTRTDCRLDGRGAHGRITAAYFGEDDQTMDFRTFQDHAAPDTTSELLFKGALDGSARSVYSGLIRVRPDAVRTKAYQTNRNIKLSRDAWAESVPNLEIETDDVMCSHASTVSPVDEEQRFYLESRGVPTPVAERLLLEGFFEEAVEAAPTDSVADLLREAIVAKLDRRSIAAGETAA